MKHSYSGTCLRFPIFALMMLSTVFFSACANDPFAPLADAVLGKDRHQQSTTTTGVSSATTGSETTQQDICKSANILATTDVDTAYAKAMSTFHFRTWEQRKKDSDRSLGFVDEGFKHDATPGAFYHMADYASAVGQNGKTYYTWMDMQLAREGRNKTAVTTRYCVPGNAPYANDPQLYVTMDKLISSAMR